MPEIKHFFNQGKMNKDFDERLVPNGQYRDAVNIQVSTSEGSNVGTVQNILGNIKVSSVFPNSTCVGAVADEKNNALYWFVTSDVRHSILEYKNGVITPIFVDTDLNVLKFNSNNLITGINIIDNLLFWTDNITEPKKINIDLCKQGSHNHQGHTFLVVPDRDITPYDGIKIREEHITVIKKSPKKELTLKVSQENFVFGQITTDFVNNNNVLFGVNENFISSVNVDSGTAFKVGEDILLLNSLSDDNLPDVFDIRLEVVENLSGRTPRSRTGLQAIPYPPNTYKFKVLSVAANVTNVTTTYNMQQGGNNIKFFDKKFVRFSYRYKYQDGEYSCFAPFSQIAFIPVEFDYQTKLAYNTGMENYLTNLSVSNYIQSDMLENVIQIDILYKESNSPIVYLVDKIKYTDVSTSSYVTLSGYEYTSNFWNSNRYKITSDIIYAALPANQLLRPWDNVPRQALAQEITGSRIVYGNYLQNYNILNIDNKPEKPIITASYKIRNVDYGFDYVGPKKSLKSTREYQLGIVYIDEYGRETPVFSNTDATFKIPKLQAPFSNQITTNIVTPHPSWAKGLKFYVKENANEYYNMAMDNIYRAEDGNLWLSFPSSERNKIDEETFLIFKKAQDSDDLIEDEAKYKVIAIENEAPDFVKTIKSEVLVTPGNSGFSGEPHDDTTTPAISFFFEGLDSNTPQVNSTFFMINKDNWKSAISGVILPDLELIEGKISITFKRASDSLYTEAYNITNVTTKEDLLSNYSITLETPIKETDSWIYKDNGSASGLLVGIADTGASGLDPTLEIIIHSYEVLNKPVFEGKFFVKILSDEITDEYGYIVSLTGLTYENTGTQFLKYFSDNTLSVNGIGTTGNDYTGEGEEIVEYVGVWPNGKTRTVWGYDNASSVFESSYPSGPPASGGQTFYDRLPTGYPTDMLTADVINPGPQWEDLLPDGSDGVPNGVWFIDQAYFRGRAPLQYPSHPLVYGDPGANFVEHGVRYRNSYIQSYATAIRHWWQVDWEPAVQDAKLLKENNTEFKQGVYEEDGQWYMELSFSGFGTEQGEGVEYSYGQFNGQGLSAESLWTLPNEQIDFTKSIKAGSLFTIEGDENNRTYKINAAPEIFRRYNYVNWLDFQLADFLTREDYEAPGISSGHEPTMGPLTMDHFKHPRNRRITYKIPIEGFDNPDGNILDIVSGTNINGLNILEASTSTNSIRINFKKERYDESGKLTTENPAVWETEPKENIDLDIYYEASQVYPLDVDEKSIGVLVSVEDAVTCNKARLWDENTKVKSINGNRVIFDSDVWSAFHTNTTGWDSIFTFTNNDGGFVKLRFKKLVNHVVETYNGNPGFSSDIVEFDMVMNEYGLSWTNCYSFGNGVESNRLRDDFNQVTIDKGAKASAPIEEVYEEERRKSGLIYSGLYNSTSGVNNLNQFIQAEKITKDLNPTYGSIQKLYTRNTDLVAFCQDRVIKILSNKDAVFNADGNTNLTATNKVLGQAMPFSGDFGISTNPESFAAENYRVYFADKQKGAILRLSMDGLTPISENGMSDYFSDNLKLNEKILGSYDTNKNEYNVTLTSSLKTISFNEKSKGWVSFKSFIPEESISMANDYYTFKHGDLYLHNAENDFNGNSVDRNTFYGTFTPSSISVLLNDQPGVIKNYKTLNYEGSQSRVKKENTDPRTGYYNLTAQQGWSSSSIETESQKGSVVEFIKKEGKWFNFIKGKNVAQTSDIKTNQFSFQGLGIATNQTSDLTRYTHVLAPGCTDEDADNFDPLANTDDGSCTYNGQIVGCTDPNANNYNAQASIDNGSCTYSIGGCMDPLANNYDPSAEFNNGSCTYGSLGCTDPLADNYDPLAVVDDGSCTYPTTLIYGCTNPLATNYDPAATVDDGSCALPPPPLVYGCMDPLALNYDPAATVDDGSCTYTQTQVYGCTDPNALNYDSTADSDDGSCTYSLTIQDTSDAD